MSEVHSPITVGIVGGGGFGTALAHAVKRKGHRVVQWSRREGESADRIRRTSDISEVATGSLIVLAVRSSHAPEICSTLGRHLDGRHLVIHVSRGLVGKELTRLSEIIQSRTPCRRIGVLAGPIVQSALRDHTPAGGVIGTPFPEVVDAAQIALAGPQLRLCASTDLVGVELCSALMGMLALCVGYAMGQQATPAAIALLVTRGLEEAKRIAESLGAPNVGTFSGLAGLGDLAAVVAGDPRPEVVLGRHLAGGIHLEEALARSENYVESARLTREIAAYARDRHLDAPISQAISNILDGKHDLSDTIHAWMAPPRRKE